MLFRSNRQSSGKYQNTAEDVYTQSVRLYDLDKDPGERRNIAEDRPDTVDSLQRMVAKLYEELVPPRFLGLQTMHKVWESARTI